ncbi:MAG TPA: FMN reductase [Cyanobacteria bacterium UBA11149]|nr:FMN reductase [Cyanobacteria bacterium UBA11367]HBE60965.1 FMN reductase [Cyanobacteria bacterium UBA11366]HBK65090.1 FMN reductase [Cyanobacteria bacterium UBA11166]HBR75311.1 FMN reductase [Cyanobacteria bacterium UBA11159]HBS70306.1 FMN reductase [Cyanobacteria bacterium UBA11153]HBW89607.1 FMN reductase [Cyanobacteria bacterium UBA11149]HCA97529.1 FMN reductase [Cyanobacteria bacterium UBA9226]
MTNDIIFQPLQFRNLTVKNRIFRSNISGRFDNYDGSGNQARINWEEKFARGGVGAIISSFVPVKIRGRIVPNYATIDKDERIPFWRKVGEKVHEYDCKFIMQLSHSGRQQDIGGVENLYQKALSSTSSTESFHGLLCQSMTIAEIKETIQAFALGARRAREAGLDGVELHSANGYLITQFLSSGINDRQDEYGGSLENRARFLLDIIRAIRQEVGNDFHLQAKISAVDYNNAVIPWEKPGNTLAESIQVCQWVEEAGADAIHVSKGSLFPHPLNPPGLFPIEEARRWYDIMLSSGVNAFRNYLLFKIPALNPIFLFLWNRIPNKVRYQILGGLEVKEESLSSSFRKYISTEEMGKLLEAYQGVNLPDAREIKKAVNIPVICTGGFQQASYIRKAISEGLCDGVTIARPLVANNNLVKLFAEGKDLAEKPCTYCNKCLLNVLENPLGCYDERRYDGDYEKVVAEVMTVFEPQPFD